MGERYGPDSYLVKEILLLNLVDHRRREMAE